MARRSLATFGGMLPGLSVNRETDVHDASAGRVTDATSSWHGGGPSTIPPRPAVEEEEENPWDFDDEDYMLEGIDDTNAAPAGGWAADEAMMRSVGCRCRGGGASCRCGSHPWGEGPGVLENALAPLRRPPVPPGARRGNLDIYMLDMSYGRTGDGTSVLIHGATPDGHSAFLRVRGFDPYFYLELNRALGLSERRDLVRCLQQGLAAARKNASDDEEITLERVQGLTSAHRYNENPIPFLYRVVVKKPGFVSALRDFLYKTPAPLRALQGLEVVRIYESNIDYTLRFCLDKDIRGTAFLRVPWRSVRKVYGDDKHSRAQIEVTCDERDLQPVRDEEGLPPFTILSYDIECVNDEGHFPQSKIDRVSQICAVLYDTQTKRMKKIGLTLGTCAPLRGTTVIPFRTERGLLLAWAQLLRDVQPDILTGYNIDKFDNLYLYNRAKALGIREAYCDYARLTGRWNRAKVEKSVFQSAQAGEIVTYRHVCPGMVTMDVFALCKRDFGLRLDSYSLNSVSRFLFGGQKDDVNYSEIPRLCRGTPADRAVLVKYCVQDCVLPVQIINKRDYYGFYIALSRVTRTFLTYLINKGQTAKVKSQIVAQAKTMRMIVPTLREAEISRRKYEGAYVEYPLCGYYGFNEDAESVHRRQRQARFAQDRRTDRVQLLKGKDNPMTVMDFSSLYPSIIIGYNLCYTTKTSAAEIARHPEWVEGVHYRSRMVERQPEETGPFSRRVYFVTERVRKGLLPTICQNLLDARAKEKKLMKAAGARGDAAAKSVHNNNQNGIKVSANSVYGFTGAFFWTDRDISESITLYGQHLIKFVRTSVVNSVRPEKRWKRVVRALPESERGIRIALREAGFAISKDLVVFHAGDPFDNWVLEPPAGAEKRGAFDASLRKFCDARGLRVYEPAVRLDGLVGKEGLVYVRRARVKRQRDVTSPEREKNMWKAFDVTHIPEEHEGSTWINYPRQAVPVYGDTDSVMMVVSGGTRARHTHELKRRLLEQDDPLGDGVDDWTFLDRVTRDPALAARVKDEYRQILVEESYDLAGTAAARATIEIAHSLGHIPADVLDGDGAKDWEALVAKHWPPIRIIPEEIYFPYVLLGKKKYFGNMYLHPKQRVPKYTAKGIESKRRDNFKFMRDAVEDTNKVLTEEIPCPPGITKIDYAIQRVQDMLRNLYAGRVSAFDLVRSASLSRPIDKYKNDPPHRNLTARDMRDNPGSEAHTGDRVHWLIAKGEGGISDRAQHPEVVLRDRLPIDYEYYAECTLKACARVFAALIGTASFEGIDYDHWDKKRIEAETKRLIGINNKYAMSVLTRNGVLVPKKATRRAEGVAGAFSRFVRKRPRCVQCNCALSRTRGARRRDPPDAPASPKRAFLCAVCHEDLPQLLVRAVDRRVDLARRAYACEARCLNCQGRMYGKLECRIVECRTFFDKIEVGNDIEDLDRSLARLVPLSPAVRRDRDGERRRVLHRAVAKEILSHVRE